MLVTVGISAALSVSSQLDWNICTFGSSGLNKLVKLKGGCVVLEIHVCATFIAFGHIFVNLGSARPRILKGTGGFQGLNRIQGLQSLSWQLWWSVSHFVSKIASTLNITECICQRMFYLCLSALGCASLLLGAVVFFINVLHELCELHTVVCNHGLLL